MIHTKMKHCTYASKNIQNSILYVLLFFFFKSMSINFISKRTVNLVHCKILGSLTKFVFANIAHPSGSSLGSCGIKAGASVLTGPDPEPPRSLEIRLMTIWPRTLSLSSAVFLWRSRRWTEIEIWGWGDWVFLGLCTHTDRVCPSRDPFLGIFTWVQWWAVIH